MGDDHKPADASAATWTRRVPFWSVLLLAVAIGLVVSFVAGWRTLERRVILELEGRSLIPGWSLRWDGPSGPNGVWLDLAEGFEQESLEIEVGDSSDPTSAIWHWIYRITVTDSRDVTVDVPLKPLVQNPDSNTVLGPWRDFAEGPGVVYGGPAGGRLKLSVPAGRLTIYTAKTPTSGLLIVRFGGEEHIFDASAQAVESFTIPLERRLIPDGGFDPRRVVLPARGVDQIELVGPVAAGGGITAHAATLVTRVAGIRLTEQPISWTDRPGPDGDAEGINLRITAEDGRIASVERPDAGPVRLHAPVPGPPVRAVALATGIVTASVAAGIVLLWLIVAPGAPRAAESRAPIASKAGRWFWGALAVVIAARVWMIAWAPPLLTSDSFDYIVGGAMFFDSLDWSVFGGWRVPGYGLFLGLFWNTASAWGVAAAIGQAVLGVAGALMCRSILLRVVPSAWATLGMLIVGIDPELLAFERIMLSESLSAFLLTLITWLVVHADRRRSTGGALLTAVLVGLFCAALVYVRANFQTMLVLAPSGLVCMLWPAWPARRAVVCAAAAGIVMAGCLAPWFIRNHELFGQAKMVVRSEFAKVVFLWNNRDFDMNQAGVHNFEEYKRLKQQRSAGMEVWGYVGELSRKSQEAGRGPIAAAEYDRICGVLAEESLMRRPFAILQSSGKALATQLGLWMQGRLTGNQANAELAAPLRGVWMGGDSNILFNTTTLSNRWDRELVGDVIDRVETQIGPLRTSPHAGTFRDLFAGYRFLRPLFAALLIAGGIIALRRWDRTVIVVVMIATANAAALAVLLYCPLERYRIAITPLIAVAAVYALYRLVRWSRRNDGPPAAPAAPGSPDR